MMYPERVTRTIDIIMQWEGCDFLVWFMRMGQSQQAGGLRGNLLMMAGPFTACSRASSKPLAVVLEPSILPEESEGIYALLQKYVSSGMPVYYSFASAANAIDLVLSYYKNQLT